MLLISMSTPAIQSLPLPSPISATIDSFSLPMPSAKRPKLSLQTSALPSAHYGTAGSNTGNARLATMNAAAATPTTLNTFNNTFDLSIRPSPISTTASPASVLPKITTKTSTRSKRQLPYELNLPLGVRPILKNSSLPLEIRRGSLTAASASPLSANTTRRAFFPEPKRVKFAASEEEVVTKIYIRRHLDISSSSSSSEDEEDTSSRESSEERSEVIVPIGESNAGREAEAEAEVQSADTTAASLSSRTAENVDELQRGRSDSRRRSPEKRKTRKRRRWEWTLSNLEDQSTITRLHDNSNETDAQGNETRLSPPSDASASTSSSPSVSTPADSHEAEKDSRDTVISVEEVFTTPPPASPADGGSEDSMPVALKESSS